MKIRCICIKGCGKGDRVFVQKINKELMAYSEDITGNLLAGITSECAPSGETVEVIVCGVAKMNKYAASRMFDTSLKGVDELENNWNKAADLLEKSNEKEEESNERENGYLW